MRHKSYRTIRRTIRDMQKHSIGRAMYCAKYPQDYIAAKKDRGDERCTEISNISSFIQP